MVSVLSQVISRVVSGRSAGHSGNGGTTSSSGLRPRGNPLSVYHRVTEPTLLPALLLVTTTPYGEPNESPIFGPDTIFHTNIIIYFCIIYCHNYFSINMRVEKGSCRLFAELLHFFKKLIKQDMYQF